MYTVYILCSKRDETKYYVGITRDLKARLKEHNIASMGYTKKYAPWRVETYTVFNNRLRAVHFEKYLKRGSGYAFMFKHLV